MTSPRATLQSVAMSGVVDAYLGADEGAFAPAAAAALARFEMDERPIATLPCGRGWQPSLGLLVITDRRLIFVKKGWLVRWTRIWSFPYEAVSRVEARLESDSNWVFFDIGDRAARRFSVHVTNRFRPLLPSICARLRELLGDRFVQTLDLSSDD